ncbi:MAG: hypothetical protein ACYS9Y_05230 [Planctomycetota bacterium]
MSARNFGKMVVLSIVLVCISAGFVRAGELGLQEKLSKEIKIRLNDVTIAEALEKIGQKAGVEFVLSEEAVWKLPQGEATRLSVTLDGPLAESITEMLNAFFMRYAVGREEVTIYPRPELKHILGRPTTKQLEVLHSIYVGRITVYKLDDVQSTINDAIEKEIMILPILVQEQINDLLRQLIGEMPRYVWEKGRKGGYNKVKSLKERESEGEDTEFDLPTSVTVVQLLDQVGVERYEPRSTRWYLSGMDFDNQVPEIRVVPYRVFRQAKLDQVVDISFSGERADVIIQRLAGWADMELIVIKEDPSWLQEEISVDMQNTKLGQAILNIVGVVDGQVVIDVEGNRIRIDGPRHRSQKSAASRGPRGRSRTSRSPASSGRAGSGSYVGKISIPMDDGKYYVEFMLRESDLTEQLKKLREEKMEEILGRPPSPPTPPAPPTPAAAPKK